MIVASARPNACVLPVHRVITFEKFSNQEPIALPRVRLAMGRIIA